MAPTGVPIRHPYPVWSGISEASCHSTPPWWGRRLIATLAIALCAATTLAGCAEEKSPSTSADSTAPVTLRFSWWGSDCGRPATTKAIKEFTDKHTNIKVQTDYAAYGPYWQKLATATAGGNAPDVMQMDYRYVAEYGKRQVLLDLSKQKSALRLATIDPAIAKSGKLDGKLLAVPFGQNTTAIAVDKTALKALGLAAPKAGTWADFAAWAKEVNAKSGGKTYGVSDMGYSEDVFELWLRENGKSLYDETASSASPRTTSPSSGRSGRTW